MDRDIEMSATAGAHFGRVMTLAAVAVPALTLVSPHGVAVAGLAVGVAALALRPRLRPGSATVVALAALAWALASAWWAPVPTAALLTTVKVGAIALLGAAAVAGMAQPDVGRPIPMAAAVRALAATMSVCLVALLIERITNKGLSGLFGDYPYEPGQKSPLNHAAAGFTLWLWPLVVALARLHGRRVAVAFAALAVVVVGFVDSQSGRLALCAGLLFFVWAIRQPRAAFVALRLGVVGLTLATPLLVGALPGPQETYQWRWVPLSAHHRLTIWSFAGDRIAEHPWRGWGMDASRAIPGGDDEVEVVRMTAGRFEVMRVPQLPLHPHSGLIQIWLELGLPGALAVAVLSVVLLGRIERASTTPAMRAAWGATFAAAVVVGNLSFGLWQSWWQASLWLLPVMLIGFGRLVTPPPAAATSPPPGAAVPGPDPATGGGRHP